MASECDSEEEQQLDLTVFRQIMSEYSCRFENPPKNAHQIVQFCKDRNYNYKYGELNPFYSLWSKQQKKSKTTKGANNNNKSNTPPTPINWDSFWDEYKTKYNYPPKKALHLWNFAKEEKFVSVKYKEARMAFDRINRMRIKENNENMEGQTASNTNSNGKTSVDNDNILVLKVNKYTSSDDLQFIKAKFLELLQAFRASILHDPANPLQLFNFINEDTKYKVRYGDVKKCYNYAVKHKWFKPMKRIRKMKKKKRKTKKCKTGTNEGSDNDNIHSEGAENDENEGEFVLEVDHETIEKEKLKKLKEEEEKKEIVVKDVMTDQQFDDILIHYNIKYNNPPRTASQIMNFAKEIGEIFKYKACRIAYHRWKNLRGCKMPKITKKDEEEQDEINEPGKVD